MDTLLEKPKRIMEMGTRSAKRPHRSYVLVTVLIAATLAWVPNLWGQGITGSITGTVTDSSGAAVSGANVTVRQVETNAIRIVTTSDLGTYTVTQLAPGTY